MLLDAPKHQPAVNHDRRMYLIPLSAPKETSVAMKTNAFPPRTKNILRVKSLTNTVGIVVAGRELLPLVMALLFFEGVDSIYCSSLARLFVVSTGGSFSLANTYSIHAGLDRLAADFGTATVAGLSRATRSWRGSILAKL